MRAITNVHSNNQTALNIPLYITYSADADAAGSLLCRLRIT